MIGTRAAVMAFIALFAAQLVLLLGPAVTRAAEELSSGTVSPGSGTTETSFDFSVIYQSDAGRAPLRVFVRLDDGTEISLLPQGDLANGRYQGASRLPAGTWSVTFMAQLESPSRTISLAGPQITVEDPTPPPTATPSEPPPVTPQPSAGATPSVPPTSDPRTPAPTATPRPGTPRSTPTPPAHGSTPTPQPPPPAPAVSETAGSSPPAPSSKESASAASFASLPSSIRPLASQEPRDDRVDQERAGSPVRTALVLVGGTMAGTGAAYLGFLWLSRVRAARPPTPPRGR